MTPRAGATSGNLVPFGDLFNNHEARVREGGAENNNHLLDLVKTSHFGNSRTAEIKIFSVPSDLA